MKALTEAIIAITEKSTFGLSFKDDGKYVDLDFETEKEREVFIKALKDAGIPEKDIKYY